MRWLYALAVHYGNSYELRVPISTNHWKTVGGNRRATFGLSRGPRLAHRLINRPLSNNGPTVTKYCKINILVLKSTIFPTELLSKPTIFF